MMRLCETVQVTENGSTKRKSRKRTEDDDEEEDAEERYRSIVFCVTRRP